MDVRGARAPQGGRSGEGRGPRRHDVVDQEERAAGDVGPGLEGPRHVDEPGAPRQGRLGRRRPRASQGAEERDGEAPGGLAGQERSRVEAALAVSSAGRRDCDERVGPGGETAPARQADEPLGERGREEVEAAEFVGADQPLQRPFVGTEGRCLFQRGGRTSAGPAGPSRPRQGASWASPRRIELGDRRPAGGTSPGPTCAGAG